MARVSGIHARGNPAFTEVEVEVFKSDARRLGFFQSLQRLLHFRHTPVFGVVAHPCLDAFRLLYHVPGDEPVLYLVTGYERVVEDASFEGVKQSLLRTVGYLPHIVEIDRAELVERCGECLFGRAYVGMALYREGNGTLENVRLDEPAVLRTFQRKDVASSCIHHHQFHVLLGVEVAVAHDKLVIAGVQMLTPLRVFLAPVRFITVQTLVCVTERHIQQRLLFLIACQSKRLECRAVRRDVFQITDVTTPTVSH